MKRRILYALAALLVACSAAAVTAIAVIKGEMQHSTVLTTKVSFDVMPGQNLRLIASRLRGAGLIGSERVFLAAAWWQGADRSIKHGRHDFSGTVTLGSVIEELGRTPKPILRVTIPEGLTLREIAALVERAGGASAASYQAVACSEELHRLVAAPASAACGEGYLFPDTYDLVPGISAGNIVDLQVRRFHEVVDPLFAPAPVTPAAGVEGPGPAASGASAPIDVERVAHVLTMASIVEKETAQPSERARIAGVFTNRLRSGMPLQTDPTVIYGVIDSGAPWDGNLTRTHLTTPTPYNTYTMRGLPPGPICNPGRASIEAALKPASTEDLYFVARGDGSHEFSRNLADHNRAVHRYQLH